MSDEIDKINRLTDLHFEAWRAEQRNDSGHVHPDDMRHLVNECVELDTKGELLLRVGSLGGAPTARIKEALENINSPYLDQFNKMVEDRLKSTSDLISSVKEMKIEGDGNPSPIKSQKPIAHATWNIQDIGIPAARNYTIENVADSAPVKRATEQLGKRPDSTLDTFIPSPRQVVKTPVHISAINRLSDENVKPDTRVAKALVEIYKDYQPSLPQEYGDKVANAVAHHDPSGRSSYALSQIEGAPVNKIKEALEQRNSSSPYIEAISSMAFCKARSAHQEERKENPGLIGRLSNWIGEKKDQLSEQAINLREKVGEWMTGNKIAEREPASQSRSRAAAGLFGFKGAEVKSECMEDRPSRRDPSMGNSRDGGMVMA